MSASALCAAVLALGQPAASPDVAAQTCADVVRVAAEEGVDPVLAAALAWHESRLAPTAVSKRGARGALQVMPGTLRRCREARGDEGCGPIRAGVVELGRLLGRHTVERAVCHYNGGNTCGPLSLRWARRVLRTAAELRGGET